VDCARELIARFAPRLVPGLSDVISSTGDLDRIRIVRDVVDVCNSPACTR
jgi:hypothetical protein